MKKYAMVLLSCFLSMLCTLRDSASIDMSLLKKVPLPEVRIKDFDIKSISLRDIDFLFDIEITNPYPLGIRLEKVEFKVDVEKKQLFKTTTPSGFKIKANGSAVTPLTLNIEYAKIINIVKDYNNKEYLLCEISGNLVIPLPDIPGLPKTFSFPFNVSKKIPAIRPSVAIHNFKVIAPSKAEIQEAIRKAGQSLNAERVFSLLGDLINGKKVNVKEIGLADLDLKLKVNFDLNLKNEAKAKIFFNNLNYDFAINNENVFRGDTSKTQLVGDTLVVSVANELSSKSLGKSVLRIFEERKGIFKIKGETFINLPSEIKKTPLRLSFDESGDFIL
ncbi:MAG: LEA type 2 family protein [Spirochaetes bacterium]|nr:LEA type 2 family protein [Spirochaetota bacterium]